LEETTIESLRAIADEEMRSVSNLLDYIVAQYAKKTNDTASAKLNRAAEFGRGTRIGSFTETAAALKKNIRIDDSDREYIAKNGAAGK
ncbi:MAG TPA: hypothetical protein PLT66_06220, partial [Bacillota bacterium]|nr:hypothetical protein [Bacillota bacterium]